MANLLQTLRTLTHGDPEQYYSRDEIISAYLNAGFTLIRLFDNTKTPVAKQWQLTEFNPHLTSENLPGNFGVLLGDDDLVVDVDPRNFAQDENDITTNDLVRFLDIVGDFVSDAFVVRTGGGGLHIYLKKPEDAYLRTKLIDHGGAKDGVVDLNKHFPGLDFKRKGSFLVAPASIHPDTGVPYLIIQNSPSGIKPAPEELIARLKTTPPAAPTFAPARNSFDDSEVNQARYISFLKKREPAVESQNGDEWTLKTAFFGRDINLSPQVTYDLMRQYYNPKCLPPWDDHALLQKVRNAFAYAKGAAGAKNPKYDFTPPSALADDEGIVVTQVDTGPRIIWLFGKDGTTLKPNNLQNVVSFLHTPTHVDPETGPHPNPLRHLLRYNLHSGNIEFSRRPPWQEVWDKGRTWSEDDAIQLKYWLSYNQNYTVNANICHEAALIVAQQQPYHPIRDYLTGIAWDGIPRIDRLFIDYGFGVDTIYTRTVGRCLLLAAVARVFDPGCKYDQIVILEGAQGIGKSRFCALLGGDYSRDVHLDLRNYKDVVGLIHNLWIVEFSELDALNKADVAALKAFLSRSDDMCRLPYARTAQSHPRQCVFIGTTNPDATGQYLRDTTGNRRYWPIAVNGFDLERFRLDRDQLWAEAVARYRAGEPWWATDSRTLSLAEAMQKERLVSDPYELPLANYLAARAAKNNPVFKIHPVELYQAVFGKSSADVSRTHLSRIIDLACKQHGYVLQRDGKHVYLVLSGENDGYEW